MSSSSNISLQNVNNHHVYSDNSALRSPAEKRVIIGSKIKNYNADQIVLLANKMRDILSNSIVLEKDPDVNTGFAVDRSGAIYGALMSSAKSEFLRRLPFAQDMRNDFQRGEWSSLVNGWDFAYTIKHILDFSETTGGYTVRSAIGADLEKMSDYRIILKLDMARSLDREEPVFLVIEKQGQEELSRACFTMDNIGGIDR